MTKLLRRTRATMSNSKRKKYKIRKQVSREAWNRLQLRTHESDVD